MNPNGSGSVPTLSKGARKVADALALPQLANDLCRVETVLRNIERNAGYDGQFFELTELLVHLAQADGKRIRPALSLCAYYSARRDRRDEPAGERAIAAAAAVELLHLGSLYHDDVIDEADTRRGVESANARWGNVVAILAGDALLAESAAMSASLGATEAELMALTLRELCKGELDETVHAFSPERTEADYRACIAGKTASLMATATEMGAVQADAAPPVRRALRTFGFELGMAFQMVDDLLDLTADEVALGKPVGHDLLEGVYTLPVIFAISREPELRDLLGPDLDVAAALDLSKRIRRAGGGTEAWSAAVAHLDHARASLLEVSASLVSEPTDALLRVADLVAAQYSMTSAAEMVTAG